MKRRFVLVVTASIVAAGLVIGAPAHGASTPSLSCIPDYFGYNRPYYVPVTRALERTWLARSESYADWNRWRRDSWRLHARYPFLTWDNAWYNAPCVFWGAPAGKPVRVNGRHVPGILLIGETLDPATPFVGSLEVRRRFPSRPTRPAARCRPASRGTGRTRSARRSRSRCRTPWRPRRWRRPTAASPRGSG